VGRPNGINPTTSDYRPGKTARELHAMIALSLLSADMAAVHGFMTIWPGTSTN